MAVAKKKSAELGEAVEGASPCGPAVPVETDTSSDGPVSESSVPSDIEKKKPKSLRFYSIIIAIVCCSLLTALEGSIIPTALPSIVAELGGGQVFIWASNGYYVAMLVKNRPHFFLISGKKTLHSADSLICHAGPCSNRYRANWLIYSVDAGL